jgi:hypothetical protein
VTQSVGEVIILYFIRAKHALENVNELPDHVVDVVSVIALEKILLIELFRE